MSRNEMTQMCEPVGDSRKKARRSDLLIQILCIALALVILFPILYALSVSFMKPNEILTKQYPLLPQHFTLENYATAMRRTQLLRFMLNSFLVALLCSVVRVLIALCSGFAFSFYEFKGKKLLFLLTLSTMMIPPDVLMVQNYTTISKLSLTNTYLGICSVFLVSASNIFIMRQNFLGYSKSLLEAARIDGAGDLKFFWHILIPTNKPIITTVFLSSFVNVWNQYVWPLLVTNRDEMRTIQVGITMLKDRESTAFGPVMAGVVIALIPTILVFVAFLPRIVAGMMSGAVKE